MSPILPCEAEDSLLNLISVLPIQDFLSTEQTLQEPAGHTSESFERNPSNPFPNVNMPPKFVEF